MENVRFNISPCTAFEVAEFVQKIDTSVYTPNGTVKATDRSHYDRYSFLCNDNRVAVVYDTSANILSITGRQDYSQQLLDLFAPNGKTVKRSTVPAQGSVPVTKREQPAGLLKQRAGESGLRSKIFVSPEVLRRRSEYEAVPTIYLSSRGAVITDGIYPPQTARKKPAQQQQQQPVEPEDGDVIYPPQVVRKNRLPSYGETRLDRQQQAPQQPQPQVQPQSYQYSQSPISRVERPRTEHGSDNVRPAGISISAVGNRTAGGMPRKAVISFGTDDYGTDNDAGLKINTRSAPPAAPAQEPQKRKRGRPPKSDKASAQSEQAAAPVPTEKRKRGRPPKNKKAENDIVVTQIPAAPEYKNGYSIKNFAQSSLSDAVSVLRSYGKTVTEGEIEFAGTPQEVKNFLVTDSDGQRVLLRYATKRGTLQMQGKRSRLFGEVMSQVSSYSDYSSALESYVQESGDGKKVSDVQRQMKDRLPTAFGFLSEQSRIDFSYGIHDFGQSGLMLSDYSVLLVTAFRGLERFIFDLQTAKGISVKMIGQAFDKDDSGKYILKSGYTRRINSVIYAEVLVSLYSEYFAQRNFFAHSDNTDANVSRSIPDRAVAQRIFDHLLDVVEYNAKKLKEIGFKF